MKPIELSFCIPVMNRLGDLQATLRQNLEDNRSHADCVEFIVVCFDKDNRTEQWVKENFAAELESGYLRFYSSNDMLSWHFGRAKNSFRSLMRGRIYASLDGDNFTGHHGGAHIIDVFRQHQYNCIFHQFQGDWGDGTCGRVSLSREDYVAIGYDEDFLPRQWDELDAMLSVMVRQPGRTYVCYSGKSIIKKSFPFRRYLQENGLTPLVYEIAAELDPLYERVGAQAVGRHDNNYVQADPGLRYSSIFNHLSSFYKNTSNSERRNAYVAELVEVQREMVDKIKSEVLQKWFLRSQKQSEPDVRIQDIVVLACVKDAPDLEGWYRHYKELGVDKFLVVDDHSRLPVSDRLKSEDVHVWTPLSGKFRYSKVFWMEILLAKYCQGNWCVTVDSDEFLSLPSFTGLDAAGENVPRLRRFVDAAQSRGQTHYCGFMLDVFPSGREVGPLGNHEALARSDFTHYQFRPATLTHAYKKSGTVRWSYGKQADWAYRIDIRYRLNRSFDSLRKFPLFRYKPGMHLNQGFHDLIIDNQKRHADELLRSDIIPILHYKLFDLVASRQDGTAKNPDAYHQETRENLIRLQAGLDRNLAQAAMSPFGFQFVMYGLMPVPAQQKLVVRAAAAGVKPQADHYIERRGQIDFMQSDGPIESDGVHIYGPSLREAVEWLVKNTPYQRRLAENEQEVELTV